MRTRSPLQAYGIGLVHGMGGSAGVGILLLAAIHDRGVAVAALALFALFTAVSMALLSTGFGLTLSSGAGARARSTGSPPPSAPLSLLFGVWYALGALRSRPTPSDGARPGSGVRARRARPDESSEFERHLAVCPACEDGLEPLRFVAAALAFAGELPEPRAQLRLRVLDVGAPVIPLHRRYRGQLLSAAAVAAVCLVLDGRPPALAGDRGRGRTLVVSPSREAVLVLRHLAPAPAGPDVRSLDRRPRPRRTRQASSAARCSPLTRRVPAGAAVLVSLEPAGGSAQPTGPVVLKAETA